MKKLGALVLAYFDGKLRRRRVTQKFLRRAERALKHYHGDEAEQALRKAAKKIRPHANYFKWVNKETEELGVVATLLDGLPVGDPLRGISQLRSGKPDPPDVIGNRGDSAKIGFEVTELMDETVTKHNVQSARRTVGQDPLVRMRQMKQRVWSESDFVDAVEALLSEKDRKTLHGGPFERYVVVLHTDEDLLNQADAERWLRSRSFGGMQKVTDAYLLFSYIPSVNGCPRIRLEVGP